MERTVIRMPRLKQPSYEKLLTLSDLAHSYIKKFQNEKDEFAERVHELKNAVEARFKESCADVDRRHGIINDLLGKYWKVSDDDRDIMYIYPYRVNDINHILFALVSLAENEPYDKYGLYDCTYDITSDKPFDRNLTFTEATKDEMLENARKTCEYALEARLVKIRENAFNEYDTEKFVLE